MPTLPAITFLGLKGMAAWAAVAGVGVAGIAVASKALPALGLSAGPRSTVQLAGEAPATAEQFASLIRSLGETMSRTATAGLGPGASLGSAGLGVASRAADTLGRVVERQTSAFVDTNRSLVQSTVSATDRLLDAGEKLLSLPPPPPTVHVIGPAPIREPIYTPQPQPPIDIIARPPSQPPRRAPRVDDPLPIGTVKGSTERGVIATPPGASAPQVFPLSQFVGGKVPDNIKALLGL